MRITPLIGAALAALCAPPALAQSSGAGAERSTGMTGAVFSSACNARPNVLMAIMLVTSSAPDAFRRRAFFIVEAAPMAERSAFQNRS